MSVLSFTAGDSNKVNDVDRMTFLFTSRHRRAFFEARSLGNAPHIPDRYQCHHPSSLCLIKALNYLRPWHGGMSGAGGGGESDRRDSGVGVVPNGRRCVFGTTVATGTGKAEATRTPFCFDHAAVGTSRHTDISAYGGSSGSHGRTDTERR